MIYPHRIRLRHPWEYEPVPRDVIPEGGARFRRRFGYPGRIDDYERVWLTFSGVKEAVEVWLNGRLLERWERPAFEMEITALLGQRNHLDVVVFGYEGKECPWEEV